MRNYLASAFSYLLAASVIFPLAGCIAHAPGSGGGNQQIQVAVTSSPSSPASISVSTSTAPSTVQYTATVTGTSNNAVSWSLSAYPNSSTVCTASGSGLGTITTTGNNTMTYTAPSTVPVSPCGVAVTATSKEDNVTTGQALVNVNSLAITVTVTSIPSSTTQLPVSTPTTPSTLQYTATVTGTSNNAVTWTLAADPNASTVCTASGSALGTITPTGNNTMTYTAPQGPLPMSPCGVAVTATSNEDHTTSGQALVNVHVIVTVSPATDTIGQGANLQMVATVTGAPSGQTGVDWSVSCASCTGQQTAGIVDPNNPGLYIAPGLQQGITSVQASVQATSVFDNRQVGASTMTVLKNDPLGTASPSTAAAAEITCPAFTGGVSGGTCYQLAVTCDGISPWNAYLKVNTPTGTPAGTVILGTGSGGTALYDNDPSFIVSGVNGGENVVQNLLTPVVQSPPLPSFTTVQVSFGAPFDNSTNVTNGWLQGPGGVRRLACRYATVADWVYKNIHNSNTNAPYCATGNSAASGAIGYAVSEYALASEFSLIEVTSGPVMTLLHQGCNQPGVYTLPNSCTSNVNLSYTASGGTGSTAAIIDTAYQAVGQTTPTICSDGVNGVTVNGVQNPNFSRFLSDSIEDDPGISPALPIAYPPTFVNVLVGSSDTSNAVNMAYAWRNAVGPTPPAPTCVLNTPHAIPSTTAGVDQIVSDIQTKCVIH